ncbi:MAG: hypothetical protein GEU99_11790 [Luteitalea sp.]|nr:hypothetical protein [Luteitalea sp.]
MAIVYRHDGEAIRAPGVIVMGKMDAGVETFRVPGDLNVTIDPAGWTPLLRDGEFHPPRKRRCHE